MRKDTRLGLGIGALLLAFVVTFLVVRNYTQKQVAAGDAGQQDGDGSTPQSGPAETNPAAPVTAGDGVAANGAAAIPPLPPADAAGQPNRTAPPIAAAKDDPFARRPAGAGPAGGVAHDWDRLLATGRIDPNTGAPVTRTPAQGGAAVVAPPSRGTQTGGVASRPSSPSRGTAADPTPADPAAGGGGIARPYTVREGETFVSIAQATYGSSKYFLQIKQANPTVNPARLRVGQQIVLPELSPAARSLKATGPYADLRDNRVVDPRSEYRVDAGDSLYRIAVRQLGSPRMVDALYEANRDTIGPDPERLRMGMILKLPAVARAGK